MTRQKNEEVRMCNEYHNNNSNQVVVTENLLKDDYDNKICTWIHKFCTAEHKRRI